MATGLLLTYIIRTSNKLLIMIKRSSTFLLTGLLCAVISSCTDNDEKSNIRDCDVSATAYTTQNDGTVKYSVPQIGNSEVNSITYIGTDGPVTVNDPVIPFEVSVNTRAGTSINVSAKGRTSSRIVVEYDFTGGNGEMQKSSAECSNSN